MFSNILEWSIQVLAPEVLQIGWVPSNRNLWQPDHSTQLNPKLCSFIPGWIFPNNFNPTKNEYKLLSFHHCIAF